LGSFPHLVFLLLWRVVVVIHKDESEAFVPGTNVSFATLERTLACSASICAVG
jgi:hypothetical protein